MAHSSLRQVVFQCFPQVCTASSCAAGPAKLPLPRRLQRRSLSVGRPRPGSPVEPKSSREFVSNATLGGKVHEVLVKWLNTLESGERHTADCILAGVSITTAYFLRSHPVSGAERVFEHARGQQDPVHHHPQNHLLLAHRASGIRLLPSESRGKSLQ